MSLFSKLNPLRQNVIARARVAQSYVHPHVWLATAPGASTPDQMTGVWLNSDPGVAPEVTRMAAGWYRIAISSTIESNDGATVISLVQQQLTEQVPLTYSIIPNGSLAWDIRLYDATGTLADPEQLQIRMEVW